MVITIEFFPYPLLLSLIFLALLLIQLRRGGRSLGYLLGVTLFAFYLLVAVRLVFFPVFISAMWPQSLTADHFAWVIFTTNLVPFYYHPVYAIDATNIVREIVGNILLTVPYGFCLPFLARVSTRGMLRAALWAGLALEGTQLVLALVGLDGWHRSVDINDVILNGLGALVGFGMYRLVAFVFSLHPPGAKSVSQ